MLYDTRLPPKFWAKIDVDANGCWLWTADLHSDGYASIIWRRDDGSWRVVLGHVIAYRTLVGAVPDGLELDHRCEVRRCVNPDHLEPVTHRVNVLRGNSPSAKAARATHCPAGHLYDAANTNRKPDGGRECRTCRHLNRRRINKRRRMQHAAKEKR